MCKAHHAEHVCNKATRCRSGCVTRVEGLLFNGKCGTEQKCVAACVKGEQAQPDSHTRKPPPGFPSCVDLNCSLLTALGPKKTFGQQLFFDKLLHNNGVFFPVFGITLCVYRPLQDLSFDTLISARWVFSKRQFEVKL